MKWIKKLALIPFLVISAVSYGQYTLKGGPSFILNYSGFADDIYKAYGLDLGAEFKLTKLSTINITGAFLYGDHPNDIDETITATDIMFGGQVEWRRYLGEQWNGVYVGLGFDARYLIVKNFFPPEPDDPEPTYGGVEANVGFTFGFRRPITDVVGVNPYVYLGVNPSDLNEYPVHIRFGLCFDVLRDSANNR